MAQMDATAAKCGYTDYLAQHLTFPPQGLLPLPNNRTRAIAGCGLWDTIFDAALVVNPAFNVYRIFDTVSINAAQICTYTEHARVVPNFVGRAGLPVSVITHGRCGGC